MNEIELKPCPFCGNSAEFLPFKKDGLTLKCKSMGCIRRDQRTLRYGIEWLRGVMAEHWNTRAALTPPEGYVLVPVAVAKDAERYQWLRAKAGDSPEEFEVVADAAFAAHYGCPENLDINIDAAMLAARPDVP